MFQESGSRKQTPSSHSDDPAAPRTFGPATTGTSAGGTETATRPLLPSIELPKGGGAIRGIGEKVTTNPATGAASISVPIATTPGRPGFELGLSLTYSTGAGNGPFGLGWSLSVPAIARRTERGIPRYLDAEQSDTFVLSGSEDLVPIATNDASEVSQYGERRGEYWVQRYRPRVESQFLRIERWRRIADGDTHWRVYDRNNVRNIYGAGPESRIADPDDPARVFSWLLSATIDDRGNAARYEYRSEDGVNIDPMSVSEQHRFEGETYRSTAQKYIHKIWYGNREPIFRNGPDPTLPDTPEAWLFEVHFDYGDLGRPQQLPLDVTEGRGNHSLNAPDPLPTGDGSPVRPDAFSSYRAGFEIRTLRLCRRVLMFHRIGEHLDRDRYLVRSTDFEYESSPTLTYLRSVTHAGYQAEEGTDNYVRRTTPAVSFDYERLHHDRTVRTAESSDPYAALMGGTSQFVDLDGTGMPGMLSRDDAGWHYAANQGGGTFGTPAPLASIPNLAGAAGTQLLDLSGDGHLDLVSHQPENAGFHTRTDGDWEPRREFQQLPNIEFDDPNLRFVDVDGDGHADLLVTGADELIWYRSLAKEGFEQARRVPLPTDERAGPRVVFADTVQAIVVADMSGDGLADIVRITHNTICYWPSLGYARFGKKIVLADTPVLCSLDEFDPSRVLLADFDGTGPTDFGYATAQGVRVFVNQSGNSLAEASSIPFVHHEAAKLTTADVCGRGTSCVVMISDLPTERDRRLRYVEPAGGVKPHLLTKIENNLGAETHFSYAPSTKFSFADTRRGEPWITRLPFPVHVVERSEIVDHISDNRFVTRYAYHHGHFDGVEREFAGFGMVEQWDTEEIGALDDSTAANDDTQWTLPPTLTRTWYHTGAFLDRSRISRLFAELGAEGGGYWLPNGSAADLLDDTVLSDSITADETRHACRALRGAMLRQEIYGQDGSSESEIPYTTTEQNYAVRIEEASHGEQPPVVSTHSRESIAHTYERNIDDPRVQHTFTLEVDEYLNTTKQIAIAYGRQSSPFDLAEDRALQERDLITYEETEFTNAVDATDGYRTPLPASATSYELTGFSPTSHRFTRADFGSPADGDTFSLKPTEPIDFHASPTGAPERRLIAATRTAYRPDDLGALAGDPSALLDVRNLQENAIPGETWQLVLTAPMLLANGPLERDLGGGPELLVPDPDALLGTEAGFVDLDGDGNWWVPSGRIYYSGASTTPTEELESARLCFYQPRRSVDPFEAVSRVQFDSLCLYPMSVTDAAGNVSSVGQRRPDDTVDPGTPGFDYRVMVPSMSSGPNRNRSLVAFDILGQVTATAAAGKPEQDLGDTLIGFDTTLTPDQVHYALADPVSNAAAMVGRATTRTLRDLFAYDRSRGNAQPQPANTWTLTRDAHDTDVRAGAAVRLFHHISYSDGLGREIQQKAQAEPGSINPSDPNDPSVNDRWTTSGWTIFNNKGLPVRTWEPFFDSSHAFRPNVSAGVSSISFYDPLGRPVASVQPDAGTYDKVVFDAWSQTSYDANDTVLFDLPTDLDALKVAGRYLSELDWSSWYERHTSPQAELAEQRAAAITEVHHNTPSTSHLDALGRPAITEEHNAYLDREGALVTELHTTRMTVDISGNAVETRDPVVQAGDKRGRIVMASIFDVRGNPLQEVSLDAGTRWMLTNAQNQPVRSWDERGHTFSTDYDRARRPVLERIQGTTVSFVEQRLEYADGVASASRNVRGSLVRHYDQSGLFEVLTRDFKGNIVSTERRFVSSDIDSTDWAGDLTTAAAAELGPESETYFATIQFDALNRPLQEQAPATAAMQKSQIRRTFNEGGFVETVEADAAETGWTTYVAATDHDALGRRLEVDYGNDVTTTYTYDRATLRLAQIKTTRNDPSFRSDCPSPRSAVWPGCSLQSLNYVYDPVGNIVEIHDGAQQTIFTRNIRVEPTNRYRYDSLYRLIETTGREHLANGNPQPHRPDGGRLGQVLPTDGNALGEYVEHYEYDEVGNFETMRHRIKGSSTDSWTRTYRYDTPSKLEPAKTSNRLTGTTIGQGSTPITETYEDDPHGNTVRMPHLGGGASAQNMFWTPRDQLNALDLGGGGTGQYRYDSTSERTYKRIVRSAGRTEQRWYLGNIERFQVTTPSGRLVRETLHVMFGEERVALVETRTLDEAGADGAPPHVVRYQTTNHLGSVSIELDDAAEVISYEEYSPYGSSTLHLAATGSRPPKRYRYTGKERDEESGFSYHSARYLSPWLGRWISADPAGLVDGPNSFAYGRSDPIGLQDLTGLAVTDNSQGRVGDVDEFVSATDDATGRYVFTEGGGWIDRDHASPNTFFDVHDQLRASGKASLRMKPMFVDQPLQVDYTYAGDKIEGAATYIAFDFLERFEVHQDKFAPERYADTPFAYEDLPSNRVGIEIGRRFLEKVGDVQSLRAEAASRPDLLKQITREVLENDLGAVDKASALRIYRAGNQWEVNTFGIAHRFERPQNYSVRPLRHPTISPIDSTKTPHYLQRRPAGVAGIESKVISDRAGIWGLPAKAYDAPSKAVNAASRGASEILNQLEDFAKNPFKYHGMPYQ